MCPKSLKGTLFVFSSKLIESTYHNLSLVRKLCDLLIIYLDHLLSREWLLLKEYFIFVISVYTLKNTRVFSQELLSVKEYLGFS